MSEADSDIFTIPAKVYASAYARHRAGMWVAVLAIPLIAAVVAGFHDIRWWLVGLMALMIVYPMVLTMAWFALLGRADMASRLRPQRCTFTDDGCIAVDFLHFNPEDGHEPVDSEHARIVSADNHGRYTELRLADSRFDILLIPAQKVPDHILNITTE